jgi:NADH-quinone oxidoreductase subunit K
VSSTSLEGTSEMVGDQTILFATGTAMLLLGIAAIAMSRNLVKTMMAFQVAVFGANLSLFASGLGFQFECSSLGICIGDTFVVLSILVGAAVEAVGLAIVVLVYKRYGTLDPSKVRRLKK